MVRKRTRASRYARKSYDSDENDSDIDLDFDTVSSTPAPKRYGLRERKRPLFCEDFDYEEDENGSVKPNSDDEEYNVEEDIQEKLSDFVNNLDYVTQSKQVSSEEPLVDFEDMIRADVVVNKQRLDYDNLINKSEIKVITPNQPQPVKGRRGRKPKVKMEVSANESETETVINKFEDALEVQLNPEDLLQTEFSEGCGTVIGNGTLTTKEPLVEQSKITASDNISADQKVTNGLTSQSDVHCEPDYIDEKDKEIKLSNEYLLANSFDLNSEDFLKRQEEMKNTVEEEEEIPLVNFDEDDDSNDVIIIEEKPNIIVLDDD
ncbi:uncharacterized protein LOC132698267 [Cylas formicarius]|uniref:uncharacterized protein LOC132698267 n=1 Tax=Cylas formicarius TaxID=197179 RepID=UPI002958C7BC|nr:uncharacterized protein LOC132698267 [Cylas formicarius]